MSTRHLSTLRPAILALSILILAACGGPSGSPPEGLRPITVMDVQVLVGVGSPIPVDIMVSGSWPDLCAQLSQVTQRQDGFLIEVSLLATAVDPNCPSDFVGLPFRIAIPLNGVELPDGHYTVTVNGVRAEFDWPAGDI